MEKINKSYNICFQALKRCYAKNGILAGTHNFDDYWARDSFFSSLGCNKLKNFNIVKKNLLFFMKYIKENGQIPLRIDNYYLYFLKFVGIRLKSKWKGRYSEDKHGNVPIDQNSLFIIACLDYIISSKDYPFLIRHYKKLERIINWNFSQDYDNDLLIEENYYAGWADSIKRKGKVLYSNVLHCKAIYDFYVMSKILKKKGNEKKYFKLYGQIKKKINKIFWNGQYYVDFIDKRKFNYLAIDGNALGLIFNIFDNKRKNKLIDYIEDKRKNGFVSLAYPQYKKEMVYLPFHFLNMYDYHNMVWIWLDCLYALALYKRNKKKGVELLDKISKLIIEYKDVYEIYERKDGKEIPVNRFFYKSETPFAWSAALFIYVVKEMKII